MAVDLKMQVLIADDYKTMLRIIRNLLKQLGFDKRRRSDGRGRGVGETSRKGLWAYHFRLEHGANDRLVASEGSAGRRKNEGNSFHYGHRRKQDRQRDRRQEGWRQ